ncbi:cyclin-like protein [Mycena galericulata]|nr:cyclin-like protein [Mycena galericulata]
MSTTPTALLPVSVCEATAALVSSSLSDETDAMDEDDWMYLRDRTVDRIKMRDFIDQQPEIQWSMRPCLVDFLIDIHLGFSLCRETLYLTLDIVDRYVSRCIVYIRQYQLLGCTALWIASKFCDQTTKVPRLEHLTDICHNAYHEELAQLCPETYQTSVKFIQMEEKILAMLQWRLGHPTAETWVNRLCGDPLKEDIEVQRVARFLMDFTLFYRDFFIYPPSSIAFGALTLARFLCGKPRRPEEEEKQEYFGVVDNLDRRLAAHANDISKTLVKEYSYDQNINAAKLVVTYYVQGGSYVRSDTQGKHPGVD